MDTRYAGVLGAACALALLATPAAAQQVDLRVRLEGANTPIVGAIVRLLPETADEPILAQGLTSDAGRISLRAPAAGRYRLKLDRIGWTGLLTPPFSLAEGQVLDSEVIMSDMRMELPTVTVQGRNLCGPRFEGDARAAALWEEIHKALSATVLTDAEAAVPLILREFRRELGTNGQVQREWKLNAQLVYGQVYATLPPEVLATEGFVLMDTQADTTVYAVPDAELLTSNEFTLTHCFRSVTSDDGLIGLAFEPVPRRPVTDIQGTLWLDPGSLELRHLDYSYTGLPPLPSRVELGGRVEFTRLPSGRWIVSEWHVRTPWINIVEFRGARNTYRDVERMQGFIELGGRVEMATAAHADADLSVVTGVVTDSLTGGGIPGVMITVAELGAAITDEEGRFTLAVGAAGDQTITAQHPRLALQNQLAAAGTVLLSVGDTTYYEFGSPPLPAVVRAACGNTGNRSGVVGMVVGADHMPVTGLDVRARWSTPGGAAREQRARMQRDGLFGLCDLPGDETVEVTVSNRAGVVLTEPVTVAFRNFQWVALRMP
ncbi:MAG: hypothetical protein ABR551_01945 [Gemmatimonadales bacterium]